MAKKIKKLDATTVNGMALSIRRNGGATNSRISQLLQLMLEKQSDYGTISLDIREVALVLNVRVLELEDDAAEGAEIEEALDVFEN